MSDENRVHIEPAGLGAEERQTSAEGSGAFEVHVLKTWPGPFAAVRARKKTLEIRRADRNFKEGDTLWLEEFDPATDTRSGEVEVRVVTHVLPGGQFGIEPGFVALSISDAPLAHASRSDVTASEGEVSPGTNS